MLTTDLLESGEEQEYEAFNFSQPNSLIYTSIKYREFLRRILPDAEPTYLIAREGSQLVGVLPAFILESKMGTVVNSLPFYGSNGGIMVDRANPRCHDIKIALLDALDKLAHERKAVSTTVITNPLNPDDMMFLDAFSKSTLRDERIGQIKELPTSGIGRLEIEDRLMSSLHSKTRNMVRKGRKNEFRILVSQGRKDFKNLFSLHKANLQAIGGLSKSWSVFEAIRATFTSGTDYELHQALHDNQVVAALLLFFYNGTVEYFTPAVHSEYRSQQPLSFLIFEAMVDACTRGFRCWNWGGTWLSQKSVYAFKASWGTTDMPYRYYVREYPEHGFLRDFSASKLLEVYPNFYTLPFSALTENVCD